MPKRAGAAFAPVNYQVRKKNAAIDLSVSNDRPGAANPRSTSVGGQAIQKGISPLRLSNRSLPKVAQARRPRITWRLTHGTGTKESALETPDELVDARSGSASVVVSNRWRASQRRARWKVCRSEPHSRSARPTMARAGGALAPARALMNAAAGFSRVVLTFMDKRRWCQRDPPRLVVAGTGRNGEVAGPLSRRRPG